MENLMKIRRKRKSVKTEGSKKFKKKLIIIDNYYDNTM